MDSQATGGGSGGTFHPLPSSPSSQPLESLLAADSFPEPSMVNFRGIRRRRTSAYEVEAGEEEDEEEEEYGSMFRRPEKKRRLMPAQVRYLERSFEVDNKLEPERKNQLAKDLNLQPRQVAIWFQNRRARFKTKQLERDYAALKSSFDSLNSHYDDLLKDKDKLQNEVSLLTAKLKLRETSNSTETQEPLAVKEEAPPPPVVVVVACKQEEVSSVKSDSDVFNSESPHSISQAFEAEQSDFSQEDLTGSFLPVEDYGFGKGEEGDFQGGCCSSLGLPGLEGQPSYWPWLY